MEFAEKVMWEFPPGRRMEKLNPRWGYGLSVGVRVRSSELIVIDQETKEVKYVRTIRRIPEDERWDAEYLSWARAVPWNKGRGDPDADGYVPDFDVSKGPGRQLTEEER